MAGCRLENLFPVANIILICWFMFSLICITLQTFIRLLSVWLQIYTFVLFTELWPLLCGKQRYHGVTMFLQFPHLVHAPGQLHSFCQDYSCMVVASYCYFLRISTTRGPAWLKYLVESLLWNLGLRMTDLSPASLIHTTLSVLRPSNRSKKQNEAQSTCAELTLKGWF